MNIEHFFYGYLPQYEVIRDGESPDASKILSETNFRDLRKNMIAAGSASTSETIIPQYFPQEQVIALSFIKPLKDKIGRRTMWIHTLLVPLGDYFEFTHLIGTLEKHLIRDPEKIFYPVKPINTKTEES